MLRQTTWIVLGVVLMFSTRAQATSTKLFHSGDDAIVFEEACATMSEGEAAPLPVGKSCGYATEERRHADSFKRSETEDEPEYRTPQFSVDGSTMVLQDLGDHEIAVMINGKEALRFKDPGGVAEPVAAAFWHGKHWIVEYLGTHVVVDGQPVEPRTNSVFFYRFVGGKPFYFFSRDGKTRVSYDGVEQRVDFDQVAHRLCCEPALLNPRWSEDGVSFFARRGETWFHVVARPKTRAPW